MLTESVRDEIDNIIEDYAEEVADGNYTLSPAEDTDRILTIIRTALLSEPAVDAAAYQMDVMFGESYSLNAAREVISASWDSVFGDDDCGCESIDFEAGGMVPDTCCSAPGCPRA